MIVGQRLKLSRVNQNLTQNEFAKLLGLSKSAICLYESEKRNPKLETMIEMMYVLGVSADYLLGSDVVVEIQDADTPKYQPLTKEEALFIQEIRKEKIVYDTLFQNPKRGIEIIKKRI